MVNVNLEKLPFTSLCKIFVCSVSYQMPYRVKYIVVTKIWERLGTCRLEFGSVTSSLATIPSPGVLMRSHVGYRVEFGHSTSNSMGAGM